LLYKTSHPMTVLIPYSLYAYATNDEAPEGHLVS
jgi:hypothetical protein